MVTRRDSGEIKGTESFIGREEIPLSLGRMEPSATKATRFFCRELVSGYRSDLRQEKWPVPVLYGLCFCRRKCLLYTDRKKIKENFFQFGGIDGTSVCRKSDKETGGDFFVCDLTGGTFERFPVRSG